MNLSRRARRRDKPPPKQDAEVARLREALRPFAEVSLPEHPAGEDVWVYVGDAGAEHWVHDVDGNTVPSHLKLSDFRNARALL